MTPTASDIRALERPAQVHHRVYTDPQVFDLELTRMFEHTWVYAGHESEIPADHEVFAQTHAGLARGGWVDFSCGHGDEQSDAGGRKSLGTSERPVRTPFKTWLSYMAAE